MSVFKKLLNAALQFCSSKWECHEMSPVRVNCCLHRKTYLAVHIQVTSAHIFTDVTLAVRLCTSAHTLLRCEATREKEKAGNIMEMPRKGPKQCVEPTLVCGPLCWQDRISTNYSFNLDVRTLRTCIPLVVQTGSPTWATVCLILVLENSRSDLTLRSHYFETLGCVVLFF